MQCLFHPYSQSYSSLKMAPLQYIYHYLQLDEIKMSFGFSSFMEQAPRMPTSGVPVRIEHHKTACGVSSRWGNVSAWIRLPMWKPPASLLQPCECLEVNVNGAESGLTPRAHTCPVKPTREAGCCVAWIAIAHRKVCTAIPLWILITITETYISFGPAERHIFGHRLVCWSVG